MWILNVKCIYPLLFNHCKSPPARSLVQLRDPVAPPSASQPRPRHALVTCHVSRHVSEDHQLVSEHNLQPGQHPLQHWGVCPGEKCVYFCVARYILLADYFLPNNRVAEIICCLGRITAARPPRSVQLNIGLDLALQQVFWRRDFEKFAAIITNILLNFPSFWLPSLCNIVIILSWECKKFRIYPRHSQTMTQAHIPASKARRGINMMLILILSPNGGVEYFVQHENAVYIHIHMFTCPEILIKSNLKV